MLSASTPDHGGQLGDKAILDHAAPCTRDERGASNFIPFIGEQADDARRRTSGDDLADRIDGADVGQVEVEQKHFGADNQEQLRRVIAVGNATGQLHSRLRLNERRQAVAQQLLAHDDENADGLGHSEW
jgi:hypothetical protein